MQRAILMGQEGSDAMIAAIARMTDLSAGHHPRYGRSKPGSRSGRARARTQSIASREAQPRFGRLGVWNRRVLMVAVALVMWAATILALQTAGSKTTAFLAGEGTMVLPDSQ